MSEQDAHDRLHQEEQPGPNYDWRDETATGHLVHVMIDIETLSTDVRGVILSVGAVRFYPVGTIGQGFEVKFKIEDQVNVYHRHVEDRTLMFWLDQNEKVRERVFGGDRVHVSRGVLDLAVWLAGLTDNTDNIRVWAKGPHFDGAMLLDLSQQVFCQLPIKYNAWRDVRTFCEGIPHRERSHELTHDPVQDCIDQAYWVIDAMQAGRTYG